MSFRENLKNELIYKGMLVKELSTRSGVNKRSIDTYLRENGSMPSADAAVSIARVLGVSVEYLVTGIGNQHAEADTERILSPISRAAAQIIERLGKKNQELTLTLIKSVKQFEENEESQNPK